MTKFLVMSEWRYEGWSVEEFLSQSEALARYDELKKHETAGRVVYALVVEETTGARERALAAIDQ